MRDKNNPNGDGIQPGGNGEYQGFEHLMTFYRTKRDECPPGVSLKLEKKKYIQLQFKFPGTDKRRSKSCGESFTYPGIENALVKAHKVAEALSQCELASEFWEWYEDEILGTVKSVDDRKTYREIFQKLEDNYFKGKHRGSGRKRSRDITSDAYTFNCHYLARFKKFPDWDKQPNWKDFELVLNSWEAGSKSYKDAYSVLKAIAKLSHNSRELLNRLDEIDSTQTEYREKQYITWNEFMKWLEATREEPRTDLNQEKARQNWLWVTSMVALYGLRPTEICAAANLTEPYTKDGITIKAISDPSNDLPYLVIEEFTKFGTSTKTGGRVILPVTSDPKILELLKIRQASLPEDAPTEDASPDAVCNRFNNSHRSWLTRNNCPVTQVYAFRRLNNWLQRKHGFPEHIAAANLGHSIDVNRKHYMSWSDFRSRMDMLQGFSKEPLGYQAAVERLQSLGIDTDDPSVQLILKVIYQLE